MRIFGEEISLQRYVNVVGAALMVADGHPESPTLHFDTFSTSLQIPRTTSSRYIRRRVSMELQENISRRAYGLPR